MSKELKEAGALMVGCVGGLFALAFIFIVTTALIALPVVYVWNTVLIDAITVLKPISYSQAWAITILVVLLRGNASVKTDV